MVHAIIALGAFAGGVALATYVPDYKTVREFLIEGEFPEEYETLVEEGIRIANNVIRTMEASAVSWKSTQYREKMLSPPPFNFKTKFQYITSCFYHKPRLHWSSKLNSIHFRLQTEFQSTNGCAWIESIQTESGLVGSHSRQI